MRNIAITLILAYILGFGGLFAAIVTVDSGSYLGQYQINQTNYSGVQSIDLAEGSHRVYVGTGDSFLIDVDSSGQVTSHNTTAASGGTSLTFNTASVTINPGAYAHNWSLYGASSWNSGQTTIDLVKGMNYRNLVGVAGYFIWKLNGDGSTTVNNGFSAQGGQNELTFNTQTVSVDPELYQESWSLYGASDWLKGEQDLSLVPGVQYRNLVGVAGFFHWTLEEDGGIHVANGVSGIGGQNTLSFETVPVYINPNDYLGSWSLYRSSQWTSGTDILDLVPDINYRLVVQNEFAFFKPDEFGVVNPSQVDIYGETFTFAPSAVPEPKVYLLMSLGLLGLYFKRKKKS